jgi:hypothetical protein
MTFEYHGKRTGSNVSVNIGGGAEQQQTKKREKQ